MRDRVPLLTLLAGALTFLASLYLPWQDMNDSGFFGGGGGKPGSTRPPQHLLGGTSSDGWSTEATVLASLVALVLVAGVAVGLVRPVTRGRRLPLFPLALALLYLAIAGLVTLHALRTLEATTQQNRNPALHFHFAYGAYLGVAAAAIALLAAVFLDRARLARRPSGIESTAILLGAGLLVAFLLPWTSAGPVSIPGVNGEMIVLAAVGVCLLVGALLRSRTVAYVAGMIAVLVGATVNEVVPALRIDYGTWLSLGLAVALVVAAAFVRPPARPAIPSLAVALASAAAAVYVIALFLPWREFCTPGSGRCFVNTGWGAGTSSAAAGTLALVVILAAVVLARPAAAIAELALAVAILTAVSGASLANQPGGSPGWSTRYGTYVGFVAAGILLLAGFARLRLPELDSRRVIDRLIPVAASVGCMCAIALPVWSALPDRWNTQVEVLGGWYAIAGVLLSLHLLRRWLDFAGGPSGRAEELVLLPLGVLALTTLALVHERGNGMTWGGWILVGLCVVLTLCGWIEQRGDLQRLPVPEILRVDRLPGAES